MARRHELLALAAIAITEAKRAFLDFLRERPGDKRKDVLRVGDHLEAAHRLLLEDLSSEDMR